MWHNNETPKKRKECWFHQNSYETVLYFFVKPKLVQQKMAEKPLLQKKDTEKIDRKALKALLLNISFKFHVKRNHDIGWNGLDSQTGVIKKGRNSKKP